jgi:ferredoxin-NADP reductase
MDYCFLVQHVSQELADVRTFGFTYGLAPFEFEPGQAVQVGIPDFPGQTGIVTISSSPTQRSLFEITVRRGGEFGTKFYDTVKSGDMISMTQPSGTFCLEAEDTRPLCFIGRDFSIPAARSFYHYLADVKSTRPYALLHELSHPDNQLFHYEFNQPRLNHFQYRLTLDQPEKPPQWNGSLGAINTELIQFVLPQFSETVFYLAGERKDVDYYREQVAALAVPAAQVHCDYWS